MKFNFNVKRFLTIVIFALSLFAGFAFFVLGTLNLNHGMVKGILEMVIGIIFFIFAFEFGDSNGMFEVH